MQEHNQHLLTQALKQLPVHTPPETLWEAIEQAAETDTLIEKHLPFLPEHELPAGIWQELEPQIVPRITLRPRFWMAAAATIVLLLGSWWWLQPAEMDGQVSITEEVLDNTLANLSQEPEDNAFEMVDELCKTPAPICEEPAFKQMKMELDELTQAKNELKEAMGAYETDPELSAQLARIEQERSELLRNMISMI